MNKEIKQSLKRSICPVSCVLDILGDKWTLLVVRDLFMGKSTYSEIQKSPEGVPTNILADRLKRLQQEGIISKTRYQERPTRFDYKLTDKGKGLWPVMKEMMRWGNKYVPGTFPSDEIQKKYAPKRTGGKSSATGGAPSIDT